MIVIDSDIVRLLWITKAVIGFYKVGGRETWRWEKTRLCEQGGCNQSDVGRAQEYWKTPEAGGRFCLGASRRK